MPRKGENIRKRKDGRWEARYEKCRDQNGRIQYGYLYGRTYEAVKKKKLAILCQNNLQNSPGKCYVFRNLSEEWMLSMRYAVKLSTYACYETLLDTHILPEFGDMPLKYISSASVYAFSEKLKQQGLSPRTIKNLLILFHSILRYGEKQGYLNLSQLEFRYPKINTSPFQLISHEHLTKLITVLSAEDSEFPIGILLCIYTGIRVGELSGIRWEDIDFDKKLLHIRRTISRIKNLDYSGESDDEPKTVLMIGPPKSVSSIRDIPIPDFLLKKMKRIATEPDSYLLTGTNRKCMEPRNIQRKFQKLLQQCEIPSINIHSLRHAFATRCTEMGFDSKTLSEILGHSSVKITMDIYVHSSIKQKQKCIVFGAAYDEKLRVKHIAIEHEADLGKLRMSKYVQSDLGDTFKQVDKYLKVNRIVLFSGTPCQVAGLRAYINREDANLILLDLVCHGVPSPKLFEDYKAALSEKYESDIQNIYFRRNCIRR